MSASFGVALPCLRLLLLTPCNVLSLSCSNTSVVNNYSLLTVYVQVCILYECVLSHYDLLTYIHNDPAWGVTYAHCLV